MLLICGQAAAEETLCAERAESSLGEMSALQAKWEQELAQDDRTMQTGAQALSSMHHLHCPTLSPQATLPSSMYQELHVCRCFEFNRAFQMMTLRIDYCVSNMPRPF